MLNAEQARELWANSEEIVNGSVVRGPLDRMAGEIAERIGDTFPMVLSVMGGAAVSIGMLLPELVFPLEFDYIHPSCYNSTTVGSEMQWRMTPRELVEGRTMLVLDDIPDEGETIAVICSHIIDMGVAEFYSAVLYKKTLAKSKPLYPDLCGFNVLDRYVSDCGMDAKGYWRNLSAIRVLKNT